MGTSRVTGNSRTRISRKASTVSGCVRAVVVGLRPVAVRNSATADRDPVIGGALRVAVRVRHVAERLVTVPADL